MKKVLLIIGGVVLGFVTLGFAIFGIAYFTSQKLQCESSVGKITIMYNDKEITGYTASGMSFNLDEQKGYSKQIGVKAYLDEFETWFKSNTNGTCTKK